MPETATAAAAKPACRNCPATVLSPGLDVCVSCMCAGLGVTYRQLDHWVRMGYLSPGRAKSGRGRSGHPRVWTAEELRVARLMARLVDAGLQPEVAAIVARNGWQRSQLGIGVWLEIEPEPQQEESR